MFYPNSNKECNDNKEKKVLETGEVAKACLIISKHTSKI